MLLTMFAALATATVQPAEPPSQTVHVVRRAGFPPPVVTGDHASAPLDFNGGLPTFSAEIGGKPFKLGFDTGAAGGAHLADKIVAALNMQPIGEVLAGDPSGKNLVRLKLYPVNDLVIGPVKISNWVGTSEPAMPAKLQPLDGIIGLCAFDGFVVTLDYAGSRLMLDRGALPEPDGQAIFAYDDIVPVVPLTVEGKMIRAHLDTGNVNAALIVPENFANQLSRKAEARAAGVAHTISNVIQMKAEPIAGTAHVGNIPLTAAAVHFPSVIDMANIGSLALGSLTIKIDPKNHRIQFLRAAATPVS
jgi:hypothetical protein